MVICEECGIQTDDTVMGVCIECADKILQRIEKHVIKDRKIKFGEF